MAEDGDMAEDPELVMEVAAQARGARRLREVGARATSWDLAVELVAPRSSVVAPGGSSGRGGASAGGHGGGGAGQI